jgi:hypothetical protein
MKINWLANRPECGEKLHSAVDDSAGDGTPLEPTKPQKIGALETVLLQICDGSPITDVFSLLRLLRRSGASVGDVILTALHILPLNCGSQNAVHRNWVTDRLAAVLVPDLVAAGRRLVPHKVIDGSKNLYILWSYPDINYEVCTTQRNRRGETHSYAQRSVSAVEREAIFDLVREIDPNVTMDDHGITIAYWQGGIGEGNLVAIFDGGLFIPWDAIRIAPPVNPNGDVAIDSARVCFRVQRNCGRWYILGADGVLTETDGRPQRHEIFWGDSEEKFPVYHYQDQVWPY